MRPSPRGASAGRGPRWPVLLLRAVAGLGRPSRAARAGRPGRAGGRVGGRSAKADWERWGQDGSSAPSRADPSPSPPPPRPAAVFPAAVSGAPGAGPGCEGAPVPPPAPRSGVSPALGRALRELAPPRRLKCNMASPAAWPLGPPRCRGLGGLSRPFSCRCA